MWPRSACEARGLAAAAPRPHRGGRRAGAHRRLHGLERGRREVPERDRLRRHRRLPVRVRRQLRRPLLRPRQLRRRRRLRSRRDDRAARLEARRAPRPVPAAPRPHDRQHVVAAACRRARRPVRLPRRRPAHATLGPGGGHRHAGRARRHLQHPHLLDEDRPGRDHAHRGAADDRLLAGDRGHAGGDRRRLRLPAQPLRPDAPGRARGSRRRPGSTSTASGCGRSRSRVCCPASRAACSCTCRGTSRPARCTST